MGHGSREQHGSATGLDSGGKQHGVCVCVGTNGLRAQGAAWQWSRHTVNKLHGALRPSEGHCKLSEVMAELRLAQPP